MKVIAFFACVGSCACSMQPRDDAAARLAALEAENGDLRAKLEEAQARADEERQCSIQSAAEKKSGSAALAPEDPASASQDRPDAVSPEAETASAPGTSRPALRVVRLSPSGHGSVSAKSASKDDGSTSVSPAAEGSTASPQTEATPTTRPVLKVSGSHEAWVYHRPLSDKDRTNESTNAP